MAKTKKRASKMDRKLTRPTRAAAKRKTVTHRLHTIKGNGAPLEQGIRNISAEMKAWTSSGLGGQTAMALERWAGTLQALLTPRPSVKEQP